MQGVGNNVQYRHMNIYGVQLYSWKINIKTIAKSWMSFLPYKHQVDFTIRIRLYEQHKSI